MVNGSSAWQHFLSVTKAGGGEVPIPGLAPGQVGGRAGLVGGRGGGWALVGLVAVLVGKERHAWLSSLACAPALPGSAAPAAALPLLRFSYRCQRTPKRGGQAGNMEDMQDLCAPCAQVATPVPVGRDRQAMMSTAALFDPGGAPTPCLLHSFAAHFDPAPPCGETAAASVAGLPLPCSLTRASAPRQRLQQPVVLAIYDPLVARPQPPSPPRPCPLQAWPPRLQ